jgi:hypothetical protein
MSREINTDQRQQSAISRFCSWLCSCFFSNNVDSTTQSLLDDSDRDQESISASAPKSSSSADEERRASEAATHPDVVDEDLETEVVAEERQVSETVALIRAAAAAPSEQTQRSVAKTQRSGESVGGIPQHSGEDEDIVVSSSEQVTSGAIVDTPSTDSQSHPTAAHPADPSAGALEEPEVVDSGAGAGEESAHRPLSASIEAMRAFIHRAETSSLESIIKSNPALLSEQCFEGRTIAHAVLTLRAPSMISTVFNSAASLEHQEGFVQDYLETLKTLHSTQKMSPKVRRCSGYIDNKNPYHLLCSFLDRDGIAEVQSSLTKFTYKTFGSGPAYNDKNLSFLSFMFHLELSDGINALLEDLTEFQPCVRTFIGRLDTSKQGTYLPALSNNKHIASHALQEAVLIKSYKLAEAIISYGKADPLMDYAIPSKYKTARPEIKATIRLIPSKTKEEIALKLKIMKSDAMANSIQENLQKMTPEELTEMIAGHASFAKTNQTRFKIYQAVKTAKELEQLGKLTKDEWPSALQVFYDSTDTMSTFTSTSTLHSAAAHAVTEDDDHAAAGGGASASAAAAAAVAAASHEDTHELAGDTL